MIKIFFLSFLLILSLNASDLKPLKEIQMSGPVMDIRIVDDFLYAGTNNGILEIYDLKNEKIVGKIELEKIPDFTGELMSPKVYSVDVFKNKKLLLAEGQKGYRELYINENNVTIKVITVKDKLVLQKARFIDENRVFLGLLSSEIILYDLKEKKSLYLYQLGGSKFSDFALNEKRDKAVICGESGIDYLVDVKSGKVIKELEGANKDNVFKVDFKNEKISTAGQDRIGGVYDLKSGQIQTFRSPFLIYATGLNQDASLVAFAFGIDNEIAIFDLEKNRKIYTLKGQKSTLNSIVFYDDKTLYSASDDKYIMKWSLK
jgi:WD40 repeat protein